jgi:hypothetical protein
MRTCLVNIALGVTKGNVSAELQGSAKGCQRFRETKMRIGGSVLLLVRTFICKCK